VGYYDSTHQHVSISETGIRSRQRPSTCSASYAFFSLHAAGRLMMAYELPDNNVASVNLASFKDLQDCQCCRHITQCTPISTKPLLPAGDAVQRDEWDWPGAGGALRAEPHSRLHPG
jgi:hypothetical protein